MALLDVSEVLTDPLFTSEVTLIRNEQAFDSDYNPEYTEGASATVQAVVTSDKKTISLLPESLRREGTILVTVLKTRVPAEFQGGSIDAVLWRGVRFIVNDTTDNSQFGQGFLRCICSPAEVTDGNY